MSAIATLGSRALRLLPPEPAHAATIRALSLGLGVPLRRPQPDPVLSTLLPHAGLKLDSPIGLAAGFDKNAQAFRALLRTGFGFVECGTVTPRPQPGNPRPRLFRLEEDRAVINRLGFNNQGLDAFVSRIARHRGGPGRLGANVGANKDSTDRVADYEAGMAAVWRHVDYITLNVSSPNTPGLRGLQDKGALRELLVRCGLAAGYLAEGPRGRIPVFLKVAPDLDAVAIDDICGVVRAEGGWLAGLVVSNTTVARPATLRSAAREEAGGLSGAPLMAPSTEVLGAFHDALADRFDLIGAGGVASGADALAKIRAGAHAVQLYSALVYGGPALVSRIADDLVARLKAEGFSSVADAVGTARPPQMP